MIMGATLPSWTYAGGTVAPGIFDFRRIRADLCDVSTELRCVEVDWKGKQAAWRRSGCVAVHAFIPLHHQPRHIV